MGRPDQRAGSQAAPGDSRIIPQTHTSKWVCSGARREVKGVYFYRMKTALRRIVPLVLCLVSGLAQAQEDAVILVAHPAFRDLEYRQTVLVAAPAPNGGLVGVILNLPTRRSLASLFPE